MEKQTVYSIKISTCPCCGWEGKWIHYDGCVGYESFICPQCRLDVRDITIEVNYENQLKSAIGFY